MAEKTALRPRKPRLEPATKAAAKPRGDSAQATLSRLERKLDETREQMAFIYGVLEEISQRQTVQAAWQLDWAKSQQALLVPPKPDEKDLNRKPLSPEILDEITAAAERLLEKVTKSRSRDRVRGLRKAEKVLNRMKPSEEELAVVVVPSKEEIH